MDQMVAARIDKPKPETVFGFWIYIMTDSMIFASLFIVFAILRPQTAGGPDGKALFDLASTFKETALLLTSSLTCGLAMIGLHNKSTRRTVFWLCVTFALGAAFVALEIAEFVKMIGENAGPDRSAFLSAFFTLVGTHGLHVTCGLVWMLVLLAQLLFGPRALEAKIVHRLIAFSLFWHFLDIIWIGIFSFVYLNGVS